MKIMGKMHILSPIGKKYAYFFPHKLKIYKIAKKRAENFRLRRAPPQYYKFHLGKNKNQEGGGGKKWILNLIYTPAFETCVGILIFRYNEGGGEGNKREEKACYR